MNDWGTNDFVFKTVSEFRKHSAVITGRYLASQTKISDKAYELNTSQNADPESQSWPFLDKVMGTISMLAEVGMAYFWSIFCENVGWENSESIHQCFIAEE